MTILHGEQSMILKSVTSLVSKVMDLTLFHGNLQQSSTWITHLPSTGFLSKVNTSSI